MEFRSYTTETLFGFVSSESFGRLKHAPISKHRALSYARNPRAEPSDKILFVAYENDEVVGYLGALPEKILDHGVWKRMTWLSCFWVDPAFRGKNISKQLFDWALKAWDNNAMLTNMKPGTLKIYERTGYFQPVVVEEGIRCYLRFNLGEVLPPRGGAFARVKPVLLLLDFIMNFFNAIRLFFFAGYKTEPGIHHEYVEEISQETAAFIERCNQPYLIRRGKPELDWIRNYPWVLEQPEDGESRRYYFTSVSNRFFYQLIEFRDQENSVVAFMMLSIRDNHLTVPYVFFENGMEAALVRFLFNVMLDYQLNMMTVFLPGLSAEIRKSKTPFLYRKKILRPYFIPKTLEIETLAFQDGDGDCVFT